MKESVLYHTYLERSLIVMQMTE